ncbi:DNA primase [Mesomycoplasma moatsii]|uniref:DNA primase n=1 Tax=Mesomycoplasma moatsii TaxID=171287 RepID=UPI0003B76FE6
MKDININDLIAKVDIVNVISNFANLTKSGSSFKTLCNVHGDKTPSLSINPKKQIYKCFVCDHGGNALDYLIWAQKFSWNQAIEYLVKESGENIEDYHSFINTKKMSDKEIKLIKALKDASDLFNYYLNISLDEENEIKNFINKRELNKDVIDKFKLGFAPHYNDENYISLLEKKGNDKSTLINASLLNDEATFPFFSNKLIFPIFDENNNIVAFSGRKISNETSNEPKYLNSKESLIFKKSSTIYNYNNAKNFEQLIIVEGFMDVIAFSKIGKENAIALMGVSLSKENISRLKKHKEILIFLDNDEAGKKATLKIIKYLILNGINGFVLKNDEAKDPDEILKEKNGENKLIKILDSKIEMIDFIFDYFMLNFDPNDFQSLKKAIIDIYEYSINFDDFIKLDLISRISKKFSIEKNIITKYFEYKPNVIELKELKNKNINTKQTLEIELNQPLNITKLLISIWQNPSFLNSINIGKILWPRAEHEKIYKEIKNHHEIGEKVSNETKNFIEENKKFFKSKESLPKNIESFEELIVRTKKDSKEAKISYIDELISKTKDEAHKEKLMKQKINILSRKD